MGASFTMDPTEPRFYDLSLSPAASVSHRELRQLITNIAAGLVKHPWPDQSRIALIGANSIRYFASIMAIRLAGHIAVPLNSKASPVQLKDMIEDCGAVSAFCDPDRKKTLPQTLHAIDFASGFDQLAQTPVPIGALPGPLASPDRLALIVYTSGSTGKSKGVAISERARRSFVMAVAMQGRPGSNTPSQAPCSIVSTPLSHVLALNMLESLFALNESIVLLPKFEPSSFARAIEKYRVSKVSMVPSMWAALLKDEALLRPLDFSSVRHIYFSSEPLTQRLIDEAHRWFPTAVIENCYGISEAGPNLFGPHPKGLPRPELSVGYPRKGIAYRLVDGVLEIKSPFMLSSYFEKPELSRSALTEDGYYRTKDRFEVDGNGFYFFKGRQDDMMLSGGENIYPAEIALILEKHPAVRSCAVIALPDDIKGEKPYAFVVKSHEAAITEEELKRFVLENAPAYLHPRRIWFVDELPVNANMKVDKMKLKELAKSLL